MEIHIKQEQFMKIQLLKIRNYPQVYALWNNTRNGLNNIDDSKKAFQNT